jgi:dihydroorotate dehydrogenase
VSSLAAPGADAPVILRVHLIYRLFFRLVLHRIDAETAHELAATWSRRATRIPFVRSFLRRLLLPCDPSLRVNVLGLEFASPLGVAAGMDKNADWYDALGCLGFSFVEVGTVTALAQQGAKRPRIERLEGVGGLLNWMGFPNDGAEVVARRLACERETIVGVNIGKSKVVPIEDSAADYRESTRRLARLADYLVLNVSSPNTAGLTGMQASETLRRLVADVRSELRSLNLDVPLLIKLGPDLTDDALDDVADVALEMGLDGLIAVNSTVNRDGFSSRMLDPSDRAGLSGGPLTDRALEVLTRLRGRVGARLVLIAVGGIQTPADAVDRVLAGATLVQAHTGFIYGGPLWPWRVNRALARAVRERRASSIADLVGVAVAEPESQVSNGHEAESAAVATRGARHLV